MKTRPADRPLFRIGRRPDPWAWPDWLRAGADGTFGNRFDDPQASYRVLYAGSRLLGAFVEVLARFRPDPAVAAELAQIRGDARDALPPGHLHRAWLETRRIGEAAVAGTFVDLGHSATLAALQRRLAPRLRRYGVRDLDGAAIRVSAPRRLTQEISRFVYEQRTPRGARAYHGISYLSRLGDEFRNWALFEPGDAAGARRLFRSRRSARIRADHPELRAALELLGIRLVE